MTFRNKKNQQGVTLLLSILIMGAITVIVFGISAITLNEIKTSSDLGRTEPAITAANASTEDYLYTAVRGLGPLADCSSPSIDNSFSNGVSTSTCADYYFSNPYNFTLAGNSEQDFYLYNPANQNTDPGYTNVSLTMSSGSSANVWLCSFSTSNCTSGSPTASLSAGSPTWNSGALDSTQKYVLIVTNTSGVTVANFNVSAAPRGLPSGVTTIKSTGSYHGVTRKIQTTLPQ